jgi:hypothetical protein
VRVTTTPWVTGAVSKRHRQGDDGQGGSEEKGVTSSCAPSSAAVAPSRISRPVGACQWQRRRWWLPPIYLKGLAVQRYTVVEE